MKQIICIGECGVDIVFDNGRPVGSMPGGRIVNAAAMLARAGIPVTMASEASADPVGEMLVSFLKDAGVDVSSVDRFIQGHSPLTVFTPAEGGDGYAQTRYEDYGDGGFDIVWPRVDDNTIVLFGGYYALDEKIRTRLVPFLNHCAEIKATMVYVPGFPPSRQSRITRVMPAILENLEIADLVIARNNDLSVIFGSKTDQECYRNHIGFYCRSMVSVDTQACRLNFYSGRDSSSLDIPAETCPTMVWNSGAVAGTVAAIYNLGIDRESLDAPDESLRMKILTDAAAHATAAATAVTEDWQRRLI